jgi:hypothetical protein
MTAPIDLALEETERLAKAATPGPWDARYCQGAVRHIDKNVDREAFFYGDFEGAFRGWGRYNDGPYIAHMHPGRALAYVEQIHAMTRENAALQRKLDDLREDAREMAEGIGVWHYTSDTLAHKGKFDGCDWPACIAARRILKTP